MKLLLRRDQKSGMMGMGKISFILEVRADLTEEEKSNIKTYKLGDTMLYEREKIVDKGSGLLGLASRVAFKMVNITVSVDDLEKGKRSNVRILSRCSRCRSRSWRRQKRSKRY